MYLMIVSKCIFTDLGRSVFHFKGVYRGSKIEKIEVENGRFIFEKGKEYLIYCNYLSEINGVLTVEPIKIKILTTARNIFGDIQ